jgi:hypothetical protein
MILDSETKLRVFELHLSIPQTEHRNYRSNATMTVVCLTAERAIEVAKKHFPASSVWQLNHKGGYPNHLVIVDKD